jgi:hypothetical protein
LSAQGVSRHEADRLAFLWALGGILHDRSRARKIAAAHDWAYLRVAASELERHVYERVQGRAKPLSDVMGYYHGHPFTISRAQLLRLWKADSRRVGS